MAIQCTKLVVAIDSKTGEVQQRYFDRAYGDTLVHIANCKVGESLIFGYADDSSGVIRTSTVLSDEYAGGFRIVTTRNTAYIFREEAPANVNEV